MKAVHFRSFFAFGYLAVQAVAVSAHAGVGSSGGGFAIVCPPTPVEKGSVQLLDLYEGAQNSDFVMAVASGNITEDYFAATKRTYIYQGFPEYGDSRRDEIIENLKGFFRATQFVQKKEELPVVHDLGALPYIPSGCQVQQVAFFDDTLEKIYILQSLWDQLDSLSQAALVIHELDYKMLRDLKDETSELARRLVATAFAVRGVVSIKDGLTDQSLGYFATARGFANEGKEVSVFYQTQLSLEKQKFFRLQFTHIQGRPQLTKAWIDVPAMPWNLKFGRSKSDPDFVGCILQEPNSDYQIELPVSGTASDGLSIQYTYKTGEPIRLMLLNRGQVLSEGDVSGGSECQGDPIQP